MQAVLTRSRALEQGLARRCRFASDGAGARQICAGEIKVREAFISAARERRSSYFALAGTPLLSLRNNNEERESVVDERV